MPIATTWNSRCELLPGFSTVKATHPRRILAGAQDVITVRYPIFRRGIIFGCPGRHHSPGATSAWQVRPPRVARRELAPPRSSWPYLATVEAAQ
jgi:hypothetical protein